MAEIKEVEEFIDDYLQHFYDPVKAREYYLRTRKLVGRTANQVKANQNPLNPDLKIFGDGLNNIPEYKKRNADREKNIKKAEAEREERVAMKQQNEQARQERIATQQKRLMEARAAAEKMPPDKRKTITRKIDAIQKKLDKLKNSSLDGVKKLGGLKNPFKEETKVRTHTANVGGVISNDTPDMRRANAMVKELEKAKGNPKKQKQIMDRYALIKSFEPKR